MKGPGVETVKIKAVENAIDNYIPARDARMEASKEEVEMKGKLLEVVRANADKIGRDPKTGTVTYKTDEFVLTLTPTEEELKVSKIKEKKSKVKDTTNEPGKKGDGTEFPEGDDK